MPAATEEPLEEDAPTRNNNTAQKSSLIDIEKRKSFADMKLAEVGTMENCTQDEWNFVSGSGGAPSPDGPASSAANNSSPVNGHKTRPMEGLDDSKGSLKASASSASIRRPDPVNEIATDLQVKIADLGNACWVVSTNEAFVPLL